MGRLVVEEAHKSDWPVRPNFLDEVPRVPAQVFICGERLPSLPLPFGPARSSRRGSVGPTLVSMALSAYSD